MERDAANPNRNPDCAASGRAAHGDDRRHEVVDVGGIEVRALFLGRAHTGGDLHGPCRRSASSS
jgi:hypothetical protein